MEETETLPVEGVANATEQTETPAENTAPDTGKEQTPTETQETQEPEKQSEEDEQSRAKKRIDRLTREKWEARREAAALQARLEEIERSREQARDPNAPLTQADIDRVAEQKARELIERQTFDAKCNEVYEDGAKNFPDWQAALEGFRTLGGLPPALVEAALESDAPAKVLHHLGKNLEEAETLLKLSPVKLGAAVAKIASKVAAPPPPKPVSKAPEPIKPIQTGGTATDVEPKDPEEWAKWWRNKYYAGRR